MCISVSISINFIANGNAVHVVECWAYNLQIRTWNIHNIPFSGLFGIRCSVFGHHYFLRYIGLQAVLWYCGRNQHCTCYSWWSFWRFWQILSYLYVIYRNSSQTNYKCAYWHRQSNQIYHFGSSDWYSKLNHIQTTCLTSDSMKNLTTLMHLLRILLVMLN